MSHDERKGISFEEALDLISRDDRFKETVYAMNTLLVQKGIYTMNEFEAYFCEWVEARLKERESAIPA
jgi:hypothetical protein